MPDNATTWLTEKSRIQVDTLDLDWSAQLPCMTFTWSAWSKVQMLHVMRVRKWHSLHSMHSWWKTQDFGKIESGPACVCKSNVEIRIAGFFCRPQLFTEVEVNSGGYLPSREAAMLISIAVTDTEMNNYSFSIYRTSWMTSGPKSNFICDNIPTKAILFFFGCSEVNSTWLITSELANQRARKVPFTCVVYMYTDIN